jgi:hypothetical protein
MRQQAQASARGAKFRRSRMDSARMTHAVIILLVLCVTSGARAQSTNMSAKLPTKMPSGAESADDPGKDASSSGETSIKVGAMAGLGFPRPFAVEAYVLVHKQISIGGEYSLLPSVTTGVVTTRAWALAVDGRYFPFSEGPLYLGVRAGRQHVVARGTITSAQLGGTITESLNVDAWFVNPRVGLSWSFASGLSLGIEAGVQIPFQSSSSTTLPEFAKSDYRVTELIALFGKQVLPTIDLLRVGFQL